MTRKILYILIEVKSREAHSRILLAYEALKKGFEVVLGSFNVIEEALDIGEGVFFDKSISSAKIKLLKALKDSGITIVTIDEEGLAHENNEKLILDFRYCEETIELTDKIFFWGEADKQKLTNIYPKFKHKFIVTGNPRIDLCSTELSEYTNNASLCSSEKFILITSNFSVNNANGFGFSSKQLKEYGLLNDDKFKDNFFLYKKYRYLTFLNCALAFEPLIAENPDIKFVLRPHPSENPDFWRDFLSQYNNCDVIYDHDYYHWIRNASVIIHSSCTTGVFTYFMEIPTIAYLPYPEDPYARFLPNDLSIKVHSPEKLNQAVLEAFYESKFDKCLSKEIEVKLLDMVNTDFNQSAAQKILEEIEKLTSSNPTGNLILAEKYQDQHLPNNYFINKITRLLTKLYKKIPGGRFMQKDSKFNLSSLFPKDAQLKTSALYSQQLFDEIDAEYVTEQLNLLSKLLGHVGFYAKDINHNVVLLTPGKPPLDLQLQDDLNEK